MMISTGIRYLDRATGGLRLGDNVVWEVSNGIPALQFVRGFFEGRDDFRNAVIIVSFNSSPVTAVKRYSFLFPKFRVILVDAFTRGKGNADPVFLEFYSGEHDGIEAVLVDNPRDPESFMAVLNGIESKNRDGSFYIFDSLTGMNELWKDERAVLDFFIFTCPKLYDLNTLAYWIIEKDAHSREFIAGLVHTTQVVFSLSASRGDTFRLTVKKLEGRPTSADPGPHFFIVRDGLIQFQERKAEGIAGIGERVREQRKLSAITQSELASRLEITPGAVSQIENDITVPSLATLAHLSAIFHRPVDYFLGIDRGGTSDSYSLHASPSPVPTAHRNLTISRLVASREERFQPYRVSFGPGASAEGSLLLHKGDEFVTVLSGAIRVTAGDDEIALETDQSLHLKRVFARRWQAGEAGCELYYILF